VDAIAGVERPIGNGHDQALEPRAHLAALKERRIMGAGLDVFHQEPVPPDDAVLALPNVVCSPHSAGQTPEVIRDGLMAAVDNVERFLKGKPANLVVAPIR